jgi:hypothetical protein
MRSRVLNTMWIKIRVRVLDMVPPSGQENLCPGRDVKHREMSFYENL